MRSKFWEQYAYIITTLFNSAVGFIKSYLFMDVLSNKELGYLALFQSIMIIFSFLQLGSVTGAYRLLSFSKERQLTANNAVMTYMAFLAMITTVVVAVFVLFGSINWFLIIGTFVGLVSLWSTWVINMYVGLGKTKLLSLVTLSSILISFLGLPIMYVNHLAGAILLLALQPISFILISLIYNKNFRFKIGRKFLPYLKLCFRYGFIPFLTGILYYINQQLERWVIGLDLGIEALGEYYLVFVYTSLFLVIPSALATLNFPAMMKTIRNATADLKFFDVFGTYYVQLAAYALLMGVFTFTLLPFVIELFLPGHLPGVKYVQIIFFGLMVYTLIDPISFILNAKLHYKELLTVYVIALTISASCYLYLFVSKDANLYLYAMVNLVFFTALSIGYLVYFLLKGKQSLMYEKLV